MNIQILMLTYNRPGYTEIALGGLLDSLPEYAQVTVWDNASGPETKAVVQKFENHPRMSEIVYSTENKKLRDPTNWFWEKHRDADFVSKIDDDCLQKPGWCEALLKAHEEIENSGILGTWRFYPEDDLAEIPPSKLLKKGDVTLMRNCWVQGSGYLMPTSVIREVGLIRETESFSKYCIRASGKGYVNGFLYPFVFEDHFDDPRSQYSQIKTDDDLKDWLPLSAKVFNIKTVDEWISHQKKEAKILQEASWKPEHYLGLCTKVIRKLYSLSGRKYDPKAS